MSGLRVQDPPTTVDARPMLPHVQRTPLARVLGDIQAELGIRSSPAPRVEDYGPTSHLPEELLLRGYGLERSDGDD